MSRASFVSGVLSISLIFGAPASAIAQPATDSTRRTAPNSDLPLIPTRPLKFTTDEGTWMNLDVSPDGTRIVFDLLGDIYIMPIAGAPSRATRIAGGASGSGPASHSR